MTQSFFLQHKFSIGLVICLQWPHLHHSGTGGVGCPGLSGVGGPWGAAGLSDVEESSVVACLFGVEKRFEGPGIMSRSSSSWVSELLVPSLTASCLTGDPWALTKGPSLSSCATNWLCINSRLPMPLESTLMASLRTVSSSKPSIMCFGNEKENLLVSLGRHLYNVLWIMYFILLHRRN